MMSLSPKTFLPLMYSIVALEALPLPGLLALPIPTKSTSFNDSWSEKLSALIMQCALHLP